MKTKTYQWVSASVALCVIPVAVYSQQVCTYTQPGVNQHLFSCATVGPGPTPPPTNPPITPPPSGAQEVVLGGQVFMQVVPGITYYSRMAFPFGVDRTVQLGQGQGQAPTNVKMAVSPTIGDYNLAYPQSAEGDPNAGVSLSASLNPQLDRNGKPLYQAKVTNDRQHYWYFNVDKPGGIVYYMY